MLNLQLRTNILQTKKMILKRNCKGSKHNCYVSYNNIIAFLCKYNHNINNIDFVSNLGKGND